MPRAYTRFHTPAHGEGRLDHQGQHQDKPPRPQGKVLLKDSPTTLARTKAERAGQVGGLKAAQLDALVSPGQGLGDQLLPHIHAGGMFEGLVTFNAWLGLSPTLQGQAGVQLCLDVAAQPRLQPPGDVHSVRVSCVRGQRYVPIPQRQVILFCPIVSTLEVLPFFPSDYNFRLYPGGKKKSSSNCC